MALENVHEVLHDKDNLWLKTAIGDEFYRVLNIFFS